MVQQSIWIGITIAVFFVGIGVSYAIFASTYDPNTMKFRNQELFEQMMSNNPKMSAQWMGSMMQDPQQMQQMQQLMSNPEFREQMFQQMNTMMNDPELQQQMMQQMGTMMNDPQMRDQMMGMMMQNPEMMQAMMNNNQMMNMMMGSSMMGSEMMSGSMMESGMMEGDEAKIRELISVYQIALNNEEIEKISTLYSEQAIFMPPDVPAIKGVEEIVLTYEYLFSQFDFELDFDIKEVVISENFAYVLSNSEGTITLESSETEETSKNQEIFILIKEGDDWKISRYMFNSLSS